MASAALHGALWLVLCAPAMAGDATAPAWPTQAPEKPAASALTTTTAEVNLPYGAGYEQRLRATTQAPALTTPIPSIRSANDGMASRRGERAQGGGRRHGRDGGGRGR